MKTIISILLFLACGVANSQTFTVNNLAVQGSSTFASSPTLPTPTAGDSSTKAATTAFFASPGPLGSVAPNTGAFTTLTGNTYKGLPGCQYIETFGGKGDNSTDNLPAWNAAVSSFGSNSICIAFGPGQYKFNGEADATPGSSASIAIVGAGRSVTQLIWGATNGFVLNPANQQAAQIHDMSLLTSSANASGSAITVNSGECNGSKQSSNFDNLTIEGTGSYPFTNYWGVGLTTNELSFIAVNNLDVFGSSTSLGDGIHFNGSATGPCYAFNMMISKSNFINTAAGITMGTYAQGLFITQSNFTNGHWGVLVPVGGVNVDQINITDSSFNTTGDQILIVSPVIGLYVNHNTIEVPSGQAGIHVSGGGSLFSFSNNTIFNPPGGSVGDAIVIDSAASDGSIIGNVYKYLLYGNVLGSTSTKWNVQSNVYDSTVTNPNSNSSGGNTVGGGSP